MTESKTAEAKYYNGIAPALVAFQRSIPKVAKDATAKAGAYSYDYATLDKLVEVIFPKLTEVGLAYTAVPDLTELGFGLRAKLLHESGEEISGFYPLGNPNNPAQAIGSAISYARRYALLSLTGVAPAGEDDDGASASVAQAAAPQAEAKPSTSAAALRNEMGELISNSGGLVTGEDANDVMNGITNGKQPGQWTAADLKKGKAEIVKLIAERKAAK
jgi:ERF superfamily.